MDDVKVAQATLKRIEWMDAASKVHWLQCIALARVLTYKKVSNRD